MALAMFSECLLASEATEIAEVDRQFREVEGTFHHFRIVDDLLRSSKLPGLRPSVKHSALPPSSTSLINELIKTICNV